MKGSRIQWYRCDNPGELNNALPVGSLYTWSDPVLFTDGKQLYQGVCQAFQVQNNEIVVLWYTDTPDGLENVSAQITHWAHMPELPQI